MKIEISIWRKNKDHRSSSTQTLIDVEPQEVIDVLNRERGKENELEQIEIRIGEHTLNKMFIVINVVNIDCLSLTEIKDILYHVRHLEFELSDMVGRDCKRNKPTISRSFED